MESSPSKPFKGKKRKKDADRPPHAAKRGRRQRAGADESERADPLISVAPQRLRQPIAAEELTELLHYAALGAGGTIGRPSWCDVRAQSRVEGVNVVVVEGVSQSDFYNHYLTLSNLRSHFSNRLTFTPGGGGQGSSTALLSTIFGTPVEAPPRRQDGKLKKALRTHPVVLKYGTSKRGLTAYVLGQEELIKRRYPVKGLAGFEDFACVDCVDVTDASPLFGLDCEMCLTRRGYELTRVSLVDSEGKCAMDRLVKPDSPILDYLTKFSGITAAMLDPVKRSLRDVQAELRTLLPRDAVLVGHSVNNDLAALKLIYPHLIDTSLLYVKDFGQRFKLKLLAEVVLGRSIQTPEREGHCPAEDALAALDLAKYFISKSPLKLVEDHLEDLWGLTAEDDDDEPAPSSRFADVLQRLGRSLCYVGKRRDITLHPANQLWHNSDKQVLASFLGQSKRPFFSVLSFSSFSSRPPCQDHKVSRRLQQMRVVFAGPFPAGFSQGEVRRLFRRCGSVRAVQMLTGTHRVHAAVEFKLLEGAALALQLLNGALVQGHALKVQRPVSEATLDFDATLEALANDAVNACRLYTLKRAHAWDGQPSASGQLSHETLMKTFGRFGAVESVTLTGKPGGRAKRAFIQFERSEGKRAAVELWLEKYVTCPALTPAHTASGVWRHRGPHQRRGQTEPEPPQNVAERHRMQKLDARLGKVFRSLPEGALSVVVLLAPHSFPPLRLLSAEEPPSPGLCFLEIKSKVKGLP
ncbi:RNA exonuclease 5-like isoform X2 [Syngnathus typhle]|uniref:RNA exonuclease 5-like isoform X2 n=1 Tax=Syngnathus typhle TaxID=161592 RepID=UPI002A6B1A77|nr:RNA exonuclease 5-like isoform X2 [Syngnathus typhle]